VAAQAVEQWDVFEVELKGPADGNPFAEVQLTARFSDGAQTVEVDGFYDGDGIYRVRFMPPRAGRWTWVTHSNRWPLTNKQGEVTAPAPKPGNHGPVGVRFGHHFGYADGTPYKPVGTTMYSWAHRGDALEEQTLKTLSTAPFNKVRMLVFPQTAGIDKHPPEFWPFSGTPPKHWDHGRFNPAFFRHLEQRVGQLRELGIEADLIAPATTWTVAVSAPATTSSATSNCAVPAPRVRSRSRKATPAHAPSSLATAWTATHLPGATAAEPCPERC
jgi:hypothetical protein